MTPLLQILLLIIRSNSGRQPHGITETHFMQPCIKTDGIKIL